MTIIACWLDESYGVKSLSALADARASSKVNGIWKVHSDATIKLFAIEVRCFKVDSMIYGLGAHVNPYYETNIGIGFAGHCFEALTVISHIQRAMNLLCSPDPGNPLPEPDGLLNLAKTIAERYLIDHQFGAHRDLEMVLFGWAGPNDPWIGKLVWNKNNKEVSSELTTPTAADIVTVGDGYRASSALPFATKIRRKISRQIQRVLRWPATEQQEFSKAILSIEASKRIEQGIGELVENEFVKTVGGVRQKLAISYYTKRAYAAFTADDQPKLMDGLPSVCQHSTLEPIPIVSKMP
ncbi:hypothetical protein [Gluconobacter sp. DsW_056]|uniref:hypothetical protein n=1 Tax=Gluconobacter sp. DsW_056 TaxID=1511209 RepID=UPI00117B7AE5|nr:hypothetical protein [Gluconobacter sp. DsW_056]